MESGLLADKGALLSVCSRAVRLEALDLGPIPKQQIDALLWLFEKIDGIKAACEDVKDIPLVGFVSVRKGGRSLVVKASSKALYYLARTVELSLLGQKLTDEMLQKVIANEVETVEKIGEMALVDRELNPKCSLVRAIPSLRAASWQSKAAIVSVQKLCRKLVQALFPEATGIETSPAAAINFQALVTTRFSDLSDGSQESVASGGHSESTKQSAVTAAIKGDAVVAQVATVEPEEAETANATRNLALILQREYSGFSCGVALELRADEPVKETEGDLLMAEPATTEQEGGLEETAPSGEPPVDTANAAGVPATLSNVSANNANEEPLDPTDSTDSKDDLELALAHARMVNTTILQLVQRGTAMVTAAEVVKEQAEVAQALLAEQDQNVPSRNPTVTVAFARVKLGKAKIAKDRLDVEVHHLQNIRSEAAGDVDSAREAVAKMDSLLAEAAEEPAHQALIAECRGPVDGELAAAEKRLEEAIEALREPLAQQAALVEEVATGEGEVQALLQPTVSLEDVRRNKMLYGAKKIEWGMHCTRIASLRRTLYANQEELRNSMLLLMRAKRCSGDEFEAATSADIPPLDEDLSVGAAATSAISSCSAPSSSGGGSRSGHTMRPPQRLPTPTTTPSREQSASGRLGARRPQASPAKTVAQRPSQPAKPTTSLPASTVSNVTQSARKPSASSTSAASMNPLGVAAAEVVGKLQEVVTAGGVSADVRAVVTELHAVCASTPTAVRGKGKAKVTKTAADELRWTVEEYKALIESTYSCEQPFAPGFNPLRLGNTSKAVHNARARADTLSSVNFRMMPVEHANILIAILELFLAHARVNPEDLWANRKALADAVKQRKRQRKEGVSEKQRYYRGDAIIILRTYFRYLRKELKNYDCQFFFPDTRLLYRFTRERRDTLTKLGYPRLNSTGIQRILLQFDAIALYQPNGNCRYGISHTDGAVKKPADLFDAIMHWDDLDKDSQRLLEAVTTKTAAECDYKPLLAKVVALVHTLDPNIQVTLTARLEDALRNNEEVDGASLASADASDDDDDDRSAGSDGDAPAAKLGRLADSQKVPRDGETDLDSEVVVLEKNQATVDVDLGLPWVSFSDGSTEAPEKTVQRVKANAEFGKADKDNCGIVGGDTTRHGISPVICASNKVTHLMQTMVQRIEKVVGRPVDVQPIFVSHKAYMGPTCPRESVGKIVEEAVDVGDGKRAFVVVLCRNGHSASCGTRYVALGVFLPIFFDVDETENILDFLSNEVFHACSDTKARWMLAPNMTDLCPCEGVADEEDLHTAPCAHVKVFGCVSRMDHSIRPVVRRCAHFNTPATAKLQFGHPGDKPETDPQYTSRNNDIIDRLNNIASTVAPLLKQIAPVAYRNQMIFTGIASSCRIGASPEKTPFAAMTVAFDTAEHYHCAHEMTNGASVKLFFVDSQAAAEEKDRGPKGVSGAAYRSDQKLIFPELVVRKLPNRPDSSSSLPGLSFPIVNGAAFIGTLSHLFHGVSGVPRHTSCYVGTAVLTLTQSSALHEANHGATD